MPRKKLTPPSRSRCQYQAKEGSFMTFGPRKWVRCTSKPAFIAYENNPREDGLKGSMSLCEKHAEEMVKAFGVGYAKLVPIRKKKKRR